MYISRLVLWSKGNVCTFAVGGFVFVVVVVVVVGLTDLGLFIFLDQHLLQWPSGKKTQPVRKALKSPQYNNQRIVL